MSQESHDWLRRSTSYSRFINPELYAKPNPKIGAIGTGVFVFVIGNLLYQRHIYLQNNQTAASQTSKLEHVIKEDE